MVIWILERFDKAAQSHCVELIIQRAMASGLARDKVSCRVLPASRLWTECVALVKKEFYPAHQFPALIEYPLAWQESFEYLKLLAEPSDIEQQLERWTEITRRVFQENFAVTAKAGGAALPKVLSFPWLVGITMLFYRKDVLRLLNKTPEDLESYERWTGAMHSVRDGADGHRSAMLQKACGRSLEMPLTSTMALWWIHSFGGSFLDPLNLMPAFHQAEALKALSAMIESLILGGQRLSWGLGYGQEAQFPEKSFCLLSASVPRSVRVGDPRVGCLLPPKISERVVVSEEFAFGVTRRGLREHEIAVMGFLENLLGKEENWVQAAIEIGLLPARTALWESFFDAIHDPMLREVYYAALPHLRWTPRSRFLAPTYMIFENSMNRLYLAALRDGSIDIRRIAAALAKAVSEYRLLATLYGHHRDDKKVALAGVHQ